VSTHLCPRCGAVGVPQHQLSCKPCWWKLPADLRNAVNGTYRARTSGGADAVAAHRRAITAALDWYRDHSTEVGK
jgi:hypothetical protein